MLDRTYKIVLIFIITLLFFSSNFISAISNDLKTEKDKIETKNNNYPIDSNALLAYWSLNEGGGNIAHDYSGHNLNGTIHGATWTNGYLGYALNFDGNLDYILLDEHAQELGINKTDDYKVSAWIKTESDNPGIIYMISDDDALPVFYIKIENNGTIEMKVQSTESCQIIIHSDKEYNDGLWHFIEGIYHGSEEYPSIELYIDNQFVANGSDWLCPMVSNEFIKAKIGMASYDALYMYTGVIDEIKTYKRPGGNQPPNKPEISGPTSGDVGKVYNYTFFISDPEGDDSYLWVDWGDNTSTSWLGPYHSNENIVLNHSWSKIGAYEIKAKSRDIFEDVSGWGILTVAMGNIAPTKPTIEGPTIGNKGQQLEYSFKSIDLNGNKIKYNIDWGDGTVTDWTDFHSSGEKVIIPYTYNHQGVYSIKANAIDIYGTESGWSNPFIVNITEKAIIFGIISNIVYDQNIIYFNAKLLFYLSIKPIKTNFFSKGEKLLISYDYSGKISNNFIYGIFNTAIVE